MKKNTEIKKDEPLNKRHYLAKLRVQAPLGVIASLLLILAVPISVEAKMPSVAVDEAALPIDERLSQQLFEKENKEQAKAILFQAPEASPLTSEGEEALKEHYVEKYMPVEGCSLTEELPETSDIHYVPPAPKPKPKPVPPPEPVKEVEVNEEAEPEGTKEDILVETEEMPVVESEEAVVSDFPGAPISMSDDERFWLEKLVEAESAGESYEGKVAVATVIANRVEMNEFPDTVMEVIRAPKQFSPFMDGSIERRTASADSIQAVIEVFDEGNRNLPHDTAFFCTTAIAPYSWISKNKPFLKTIGNHSFYLK